MREFIEIQYKLYRSGGKSIGIEKIKALADIFLTAEEKAELLGGEGE